jgi:nucleoside-triphosphatase THEP1
MKTPGYLPAGRFYFNPSALRAGNRIVDQAILNHSEVILIDEIGPLELAGKIWHQPLLRLLEEFPGILVFSSRKRMIEKIMDKYGIYEAFVEDIEQTNPRTTGDAIVSILKKA